MDKEYRDRELFDKIAEDYSKKDRTPSSKEAREFILKTALNFKNDSDFGKIIEPGCGIGASAQYLKGYFTEYTGIDQSEELIKNAEKFNNNIKNTRFLASNIKDAHIEDNSIDTILLSGALHHMTDLDSIMKKLKNTAKPGCRIIAIEPHRHNPLISLMRLIRKKTDKSYSEDQIFFKEKELCSLFKRNGVQNIEVKYISYLSQPFAQVILPFQPVTHLLSRFSIFADRILHKIIFRPFCKLSFLIVIRGNF